MEPYSRKNHFRFPSGSSAPACAAHILADMLHCHFASLSGALWVCVCVCVCVVLCRVCVCLCVSVRLCVFVCLCVCVLVYLCSGCAYGHLCPFCFLNFFSLTSAFTRQRNVLSDLQHDFLRVLHAFLLSWNFRAFLLFFFPWSQDDFLRVLHDFLLSLKFSCFSVVFLFFSSSFVVFCARCAARSQTCLVYFPLWSLWASVRPWWHT
jgi:hypothetical protein